MRSIEHKSILLTGLRSNGYELVWRVLDCSEQVTVLRTPHELPDDLPAPLTAMLRSCLDYDPTVRPTAVGLMKILRGMLIHQQVGAWNNQVYTVEVFQNLALCCLQQMLPVCNEGSSHLRCLILPDIKHAAVTVCQHRYMLTYNTDIFCQVIGKSTFATIEIDGWKLYSASLHIFAPCCWKHNQIIRKLLWDNFKQLTTLNYKSECLGVHLSNTIWKLKQETVFKNHSRQPADKETALLYPRSYYLGCFSFFQ